MATPEQTQTPSTNIVSVELPPEVLDGAEANLARTSGEQSAVISPKAWQVNAEPGQDPESAVALGSLYEVAMGVVRSDRVHEHVLVTKFGADPEKPEAMAFASARLTRRELEAERTDIVDKVNGVLTGLKSPYRL